jgi:tripartite-type tricarboxylate transporter receptor subunit TctC
MLASAPLVAHAQKYPSKPIRLISADAPGSNGDIVARIIVSALGEELGQPVVVDNRPGGGGLIGSSLAAKADPDGYTMLTAVAYTMIINPSIHEKLPYNPDTDLVPLGATAFVPFGIFVRADGPKSFADLVQRIKANPGKLNGGATSPGSFLHLSLEAMKKSLQLDLLTVVYKGSALGSSALLQGEIDVYVDTFGAVMGLLKTGKIRALAVTTSKRTLVAPDVPTLDELGVAGFDASGWSGFFVPGGTPRSIRAVLEPAFAKAMQSAKVRERLETLNYDPAWIGSEQVVERVARDRERWRPVVHALGLKPQ